MNAIVLEAHGLHLGYLGCFGAEYAATAAMDRLAAHGVVFDQHIADCPARARRTSWTGRYDFPAAAAKETAEPNMAPALPEWLRSHGASWEMITARSRADLGGTDLAGRLAAALEAALTTVEGLPRRRHWLVWVELPSLAPPWKVDEEDEHWLEPPEEVPHGLGEEEFTRLQNTYAAVVAILDDAVGQFTETLERRGRLDDVLLCLTARSGLALGEHGVISAEAPRPHEELIHLPLIFRLPGADEARRRSEALTQPVDLPPTLLEALGLPVPPNLHGRSLWPLVRGEAELVRPYACAGLEYAGEVELLLRTPDWAYFLPLGTEPSAAGRAPQLFAKPEDRWEVHNVIQLYEPWAEHLDQTLRAFVAATRVPEPFEVPQLRDLESVLDDAAVTQPDPRNSGAIP